MTVAPDPQTYDYAVFGILVYEFDADEIPKNDQKIRRALKRKQLGAFDEERIGQLRRLKDELRRELQLGPKSKFYRGATSLYASPEDFEQARLVDEMAQRYPKVDGVDLGRMLSLSLYVHYLR